MSRDEKLVKMLQLARDQFTYYGDSHMAKSPPQLGKAHANYKLVSSINEVLMSGDDRLDG